MYKFLFFLIDIKFNFLYKYLITYYDVFSKFYFWFLLYIYNFWFFFLYLSTNFMSELTGPILINAKGRDGPSGANGYPG